MIIKKSLFEPLNYLDCPSNASILFLLPRVCKRKRIDKQSHENLKELVAVAELLFNDDDPRIKKKRKESRPSKQVKNDDMARTSG